MFQEGGAKREFREYAFPNRSLGTRGMLPRSRVGLAFVTLSPCHLVTLSLFSRSSGFQPLIVVRLITQGSFDFTVQAC